MTETVALMPELTVTPVFKMMDLENIPKSQAQGRMVKELREVVEIRFAGENKYSPVMPAHAFWKREGGNVITYSERWAEQYRRFKEGEPMQAEGTPIAMLSQYGITEEEQSLCRTFKIYSIEALHALEGPNLKNLGMVGNKLKDKARKFMQDRSSGADVLKELEELKAQIAAMQNGVVNPVPTKDPAPEEMSEALFEAMSEPDLRAYIEEKSGAKPDGRLGKAALVNMAKGL
jgi:hypothetical protein